MEFSKLSPERRSGMLQLIRRWKGTGSGTELLEEGLRVLSAKKRESASEILDNEISEISAMACVYGRGRRPKLAVSREEAALLLELVAGINGTQADQATKREMVGLAADVLLSGQKPSTLADPRWKPLLDLLSGFEPGVRQSALF